MAPRPKPPHLAAEPIIHSISRKAAGKIRLAEKPPGKTIAVVAVILEYLPYIFTVRTTHSGHFSVYLVIL